MINFESVGIVAHAAVNGDFNNAFFKQVYNITDGESPVYGATCDTMGIKSLEMNIELNAYDALMGGE